MEHHMLGSGFHNCLKEIGGLTNGTLIFTSLFFFIKNVLSPDTLFSNKNNKSIYIPKFTTSYLSI